MKLTESQKYNPCHFDADDASRALSILHHLSQDEKLAHHSECAALDSAISEYNGCASEVTRAQFKDAFQRLLPLAIANRERDKCC
jgi:hypothetical protein